MHIRADDYIKLTESSAPEENNIFVVITMILMSVCTLLHKGSLGAVLEAKFEAVHRTSSSAMTVPEELVLFKAAPRAS